jgi:hypothetical protein
LRIVVTLGREIAPLETLTPGVRKCPGVGARSTSRKTDWKGLQTRGEDITGEASVNEIFREI